MAEQIGNRERDIHAGVFAFWLIIQLAALAVAAGRFPLSSRYPKNGEEYALGVILVTQTLAASLLSPKLARGFACGLIAVVTAVPLGTLAAFLADAPLSRGALAELYLAIWIFALATWLRILRRDIARVVFSSLATLLAVMGPVSWYLGAEFVNESWDTKWQSFSLIGPVMGALSLIVPDKPALRAFTLPVLILLLGIPFTFFARLSRTSSADIIPYT